VTPGRCRPDIGLRSRRRDIESRYSGNDPLPGWDWNDRISSVHIPPGKTVMLFQDWHFGGATLTLTGDVADLRDFGWNDFASSIQIR